MCDKKKTRTKLSAPLAMAFGLSVLLSVPANVSLAQVADDYGTGSATNYCPKLTTTMQRGARDASFGGQVSELQRFLSDYFDLDPDELVTGYFGRITQGYVQKFQKEQGLPNFGIAGSMTRASIAKACANNAISTTASSVQKATNATASAGAATAAINGPLTTYQYERPSIRGTASNIDKISISVKKESTSGNYEHEVTVPVSAGRWEANFEERMSLGGSYEVIAYARSSSGAGVVLDQETMNVTPSAFTIDPRSLSAIASHPMTLSGTAPAGSGNLDITITYPQGGKFVRTVPYANGTWSESLEGFYDPGKYEVLVMGANSGSGIILALGYLVVTSNPLTTAPTNTIETATVPASISITSASTAISPAMLISVQYDHMPPASVRILSSDGQFVWSQLLTQGGGGSTVVTLTKVLPSGDYTAVAYGSDGTIFATSAPYHFAVPSVRFTASSGSPASVTLSPGQTATDDGVKITFDSLAVSQTGAPVANLSITANGYRSGSYPVVTGQSVGNFSDFTVVGGGINIAVSSVSQQTNTVTLTITVAQKG